MLPWGDAVEAQRARRIAARIGDATVFERRISLPEWAAVLAGAAVVVGTDSGLVHLAAACGAPTAAIFVATQPALFGIDADTPYRNLGAPGQPVEPAEVLAAVESMLAETKPLPDPEPRPGSDVEPGSAPDREPGSNPDPDSRPVFVRGAARA